MNLRYLDLLLKDKKDLLHLQDILSKTGRCCTAVEKGMNLADVLDSSNLESLKKTWGSSEGETGVQVLLKIALSQYESQSLTIRVPIDDKKKIGFLFKTLGGWRQFDVVLSFFHLGIHLNKKDPFLLVNPQRAEHWQKLREIPEGTLVSFFVKTKAGKRSTSQEKLACDRIRSVFELVQNQNDFELPSQPKPVPQRKSKPAPSIYVKKKQPVYSEEDGPVLTTEVVISKLDTFVHAGNAHLITGHLDEYSGLVKLFVYRGGKVPVQLDADSIWSAEIRNGEKVIYEFFGPRPSDEFVKDLIQKTNKYTQMDKVANE